MPTVTITFNANQDPKISCAPDPVHVPYGSNQQVTWNVNQPGVTFASNGIAFKAASPGSLQRVSDTQYTLTDDNGNTSGNPIDYAYGINLMYGGSPYSLDPEVANDSRSGMLRYQPK